MEEAAHGSGLLLHSQLSINYAEKVEGLQVCCVCESTRVLCVYLCAVCVHLSVSLSIPVCCVCACAYQCAVCVRPSVLYVYV